jgi:hypothetical protein
MLPLLLLAASLLTSQHASTECVDNGADHAATETQAARGPSGASAVLKVSTEDDHSKNSHTCNAEYQLIVTPASGGAPVVVDLLTADDDYGRTLSLRLDGFSRDGKRILGIFSESSRRTTTFLFDYDMTNGNVQLVDLKMRFAGMMPSSCSSSFGVTGTTEAGAIILELNSDKPCGAVRRWMLDRATGKPQRIAQSVTVVGLYEFKSGIQ